MQAQPKNPKLSGKEEAGNKSGGKNGGPKLNPRDQTTTWAKRVGRKEKRGAAPPSLP